MTSNWPPSAPSCSSSVCVNSSSSLLSNTCRGTKCEWKLLLHFFCLDIFTFHSVENSATLWVLVRRGTCQSFYVFSWGTKIEFELKNWIYINYLSYQHMPNYIVCYSLLFVCFLPCVTKNVFWAAPWVIAVIWVLVLLVKSKTYVKLLYS